MAQVAAINDRGLNRLHRVSPLFQSYSREEWAAFRSGGSVPFSASDLQALSGLNEIVSTEEATAIYPPLSYLLSLHMAAARHLNHTITDGFFARPPVDRPFVIGIAGSVAVGKSTFARLLQAILSRAPERPKVALVATDGFLHPTSVLTQRGLMRRKGFPESYDLRRMLAFLIALKTGEPALQVPVYSHHSYDIVPGKFQDVDQPDIVIFEGLNVLQPASWPVVASDYFDFSIYLDADADHIERWYVERFLLLQKTVFQDPKSYFHHYKNLNTEQARETASSVWHDINLPNLRTNIEPTRERASLVLRKGSSHALEEVWLRRT